MKDDILKSGPVDINNKIQMLARHVENATSVLRHAMTKQSIPIPDSSVEKRKYTESKLGHLSEFTNTYLSLKWRGIAPSEYEFLKQHLVLIKDFKVVSEIDFALGRLQTVFDAFASEQKNKIDRHFDKFMLFSQMEETCDLSWSC